MLIPQTPEYQIKTEVMCDDKTAVPPCHDHWSVTLRPAEAKESFGGMRLLRSADINVGAHDNAYWRMPCRGAQDTATKKTLAWDNKHITWFGRTQFWLWDFVLTDTVEEAVKGCLLNLASVDLIKCSSWYVLRRMDMILSVALKKMDLEL